MRYVAVGRILAIAFVLQGVQLVPTMGRAAGDTPKAGGAIDAKDWPMYNCNVLGWRHNAAETALSKMSVTRLEEKWRFPPKGADFEIGVIHATPAVVGGYVYFGTVNKATFYKLTPGDKVKWLFRLNQKDDRIS